MPWYFIIPLALVQGLAELLPVSSSAHVILVGSLLGFDPSSPHGAFLLIMLHTGTMGAVWIYFWPRWKALFRRGPGNENFQETKFFAKAVIAATAVTGVLGLALKALLESWMSEPGQSAEIEGLFKNLPLVGLSLVGVGILIIFAGRYLEKRPGTRALNLIDAILIGAVQGLCLPFRGFSRSGATISTGFLRGISKDKCEEFSFMLAVVLTPPLIVREIHRMKKMAGVEGLGWDDLTPGLLGMAASFIAGWIALKWLSNWMERGKWSWFGYYCFVVAAITWTVHFVHHPMH